MADEKSFLSFNSSDMCNCNKRSAPAKKNTVRNNFTTNIPKPAFPAKKKTSPGESGPENETDIPGETLADKCQTFAYMLGLEEPVPERVLIAALDNAVYGRRLLLSRENEKVLYDLLNNPPVNNTAQHTGTKLITRAGKAFIKWAVSGFPTVSAETLKRREDACLACPNLIEPVSMLQRHSAPAAINNSVGSRTGNKVCSSCGCVVRNKIRLATESCPELAAGPIKLSRWGDDVK